MQEPAVHQDVVEAQGTPLTGFDLDFVGDGLGHGLPPHPGEELLFDVVDEDADEHAGHGHRHHAEHHQIRSAELSAALDQESEAPLAARSSAPTRFIQHHASAIWSAPKTIGRAEGMHTVQKSCQFVAP